MTDFADPLDILARTAYGENRSGGVVGMQSVLNVVMNRANNPRWWGRTPLAVCLAINQFSVWNAYTTGAKRPDPNYEATTAATPQDSDFAIALGLARKALDGTLPDITDGADSYYDLGIAAPKWCAGAWLTCIIAGQAFWRVELDQPSHISTETTP